MGIDEQGMVWISDVRILALVLIVAVAALVWCYRMSNQDEDDARPTRLSGGHRVRPRTVGYASQHGSTRTSQVAMIGASARRLPKRPAA